MKFRKFVVLFSSILLFTLLCASTFAVPGGKDTLEATANTSSGGIVPFTPGQAPNQYFYYYSCAFTGAHTSDSINIDLALDNTNGTSPQNGTASFNVTGSPDLVSAISLSSSSIVLPDDGSTHTLTITIALNSLPAGVYEANVLIAGTPSNQVQGPSHNTIHIRVITGCVLNANTTRCFLTDSQFNLLSDCSGAPVSDPTGGTFAIVVNSKKTVVSTNPGQFYYNLLWTNDTGSTHTVELDFTRENLIPQGTNAVHAEIFASGAVDITTPLLSQFDMVNNDGIPCGAALTNPTVCKTDVTVEDGQTLWVTWHLAYENIGQRTTSLSLINACDEALHNDDGTIRASCAVKDSGSGALLTSCDTSAQGYLKK